MRWLDEIQTIDTRAFGWCMARRHIDKLAGWARIISRTADGHLYLLFALLLWLNGETQLLFALFCAFFIERLIYFVLKNSFKRNRPAQAICGFESFIVPADKFSLPSGHTSAAFLTACYLTTLFPSLGVLFYLWAVTVGLSRIFLGVHFPTDVLIGALLGSTTAALTLLFLC